MEYWIYIAILGAFTFMETKSDTIVYPGKSALHSYSPARGEFPVESVFGRGYFSYIDDHGVARLVNLEPNPLFGVRVVGDGKLSADQGNSVDLRNDLNSQRQKDRLKPIKEFDETPFQDNLGVQAEKDVFPSRVTGGIVELPAISKQQPSSGIQPGNTYLLPQNVPLMYSSQAEIASRPTLVQSALYPGNPFLNQQVLLPVQKPSMPEQFLFVPSSSGAMNLAQIAASQASPGQFLVFPQPPAAATEASMPSSSQAPLSSSESPIIPQPISSSSNESPSSTPSSLQSGQGQFPVNSTPINPPSPQAPTQPINSVSFQPIMSKPQAITPIPIFSAPILPIADNGNPFFPPSRHPSGMLSPQQEIFMIQPGNPFFSFNNNQVNPAVWPVLPTSTTPAPSINADKTNPFLPNSLKADIKLSEVQGQSTSTTAKSIVQSFIPMSCDFHSVGGPIPEEVKDSPEVEQAKRDHFRAHELALAQLQQARQNNDNASEEVNESSSLTPPAPPSSSLVTSDNSSSSTETANAPLDQLAVTSGPTITFDQTSTHRAAESEASTLQPLPV